jgi:hypothetical protein
MRLPCPISPAFANSAREKKLTGESRELSDILGHAAPQYVLRNLFFFALFAPFAVNSFNREERKERQEKPPRPGSVSECGIK